MNIAFKEWAVICDALLAGRQALILRKGGIHEEAGLFRPEHTRFWLYPTYLHQQSGGLKPAALPRLAELEAARPQAGTVPLTAYAEVAGIYHVHDLASALALDDLHEWAPATVEQRFHYRTPGLYVLPVRIHRLPKVHSIVETPEYLGCKTWVTLDEDLPTEGAEPVLGDDDFAAICRRIEQRLNPVMRA